MKYNLEKHHRRSIRLKHYDYSQPGAYFITLCTQNRECLFGEIVDGQMVLNQYGKIVEQYWTEIPLQYTNTVLDKFIVMPNHLHGIIIITDIVGAIPVGAIPVGAIHELPLSQNESPQSQNRRNMIIPKIIGWFKMNSAKQINQLRQTPGVSVWQRNFYEHIIRDDELNRIQNYIVHNPLNWQSDGEKL